MCLLVIFVLCDGMFSVTNKLIASMVYMILCSQTHEWSMWFFFHFLSKFVFHGIL